jgi:hypothetical protein
VNRCARRCCRRTRGPRSPHRLAFRTHPFCSRRHSNHIAREHPFVGRLWSRSQFRSLPTPDHGTLRAGAASQTISTAIPNLHRCFQSFSDPQLLPSGFRLLSARVLSGTASLDGLKSGLTAPGGAAIFCFRFSLAVGAALTDFGSPA